MDIYHCIFQQYPFSEIILNHPKSKPQLIRMSQAEVCDDINASNRPTVSFYKF